MRFLSGRVDIGTGDAGLFTVFYVTADHQEGTGFPLPKYLAVQLAVAVIVTIGAWLFYGTANGISAAAGGLICSMGNGFAAWQIFRKSAGEASAHGELSSLYRAELGKFAIIIGLSALLFAAGSVKILAFLVGCVSVLVAATLAGATHNPDIKRIEK